MFTRCSRMHMDDSDIAESLNIITKYSMRVYVHAPYIINLCINPEVNIEKDQYVTNCLMEHLRYAKAFGAKGVVVHVGKAIEVLMAPAQV